MAATTFLSMVQRAYRLGAMQGSVATVTAPGFVSTLQASISEQWSDIQTDQTKDFTFMEGVQLFDTVPMKHTYSAADMFGINEELYGKFKGISYHRGQYLTYLPLTLMADKHRFDQPSLPSNYSDDNANGSVIINIPDAVYSLKLDYKKATQRMKNDDDVFSGPSDAESAVIYGGLMKFASIIGDTSLLTIASNGWDDMYPAMCSAYNKTIEMVEPNFII